MIGKSEDNSTLDKNENDQEDELDGVEQVVVKEEEEEEAVSLKDVLSAKEGDTLETNEVSKNNKVPTEETGDEAEEEEMNVEDVSALKENTMFRDSENSIAMNDSIDYSKVGHDVESRIDTNYAILRKNENNEIDTS